MNFSRRTALMPLCTAAALAAAACLSGCEIFASIPDRTLASSAADPCPPSGVWPDSPTTFCSDGTASIDCGSPFATGQDGSYLSQLPEYSYKLGWSMSSKYSVLDGITGLLWEETAAAFVPWGGAEAYCASLGPGWRLPSRLELLSILDYGRTEPATDPHFAFSSTVGDFCGSKSRTPEGAVWGFDFATGSLDYRTAAMMRIRCVLGEEAQGCLAPSEDGHTVRDSRTGLIWMRHPPEELFTWPGALDYCESLVDAGFGNWRLPSVKELQSLVDDTRHSPAIDPELFPATSGVFWSSTPNAMSPDQAWSVDFNLGGNATETAAMKRHARCTR